MLILPGSSKTGGRAPTYVRGINWASPLARGLDVFATSINGGFRDIAAQRLAITQTGSPGRSVLIGVSAVGRHYPNDFVYDTISAYRGLDGLSKYSVHAIIQFDTLGLGSPDFQDIVSNGSGSAALTPLILRYTGTAFGGPVIDFYKGFTPIASSVTPAAGVTYRVTGVNDGTNLTIYVNATSDSNASGGATGTNSDNKPLAFGTHTETVGQRTLAGAMLHAGIWTRDLNPNEVDELHSGWNIYDQSTTKVFLPAAAATPTIIPRPSSIYVRDQEPRFPLPKATMYLANYIGGSKFPDFDATDETITGTVSRDPAGGAYFDDSSTKIVRAGQETTKVCTWLVEADVRRTLNRNYFLQNRDWDDSSDNCYSFSLDQNGLNVSIWEDVAFPPTLTSSGTLPITRTPWHPNPWVRRFAVILRPTNGTVLYHDKIYQWDFGGTRNGGTSSASIGLGHLPNYTDSSRHWGGVFRQAIYFNGTELDFGLCQQWLNRGRRSGPVIIPPPVPKPIIIRKEL